MIKISGINIAKVDGTNAFNLLLKMFKIFDLTFSTDVCEYLKDQYIQNTLILEYGSGGSTLFGARSKGTTLISVESSAEWLVQLMSSYKEQQLEGDIIPIWADIGSTKEWGYPVNNEKRENFPNYAGVPWQYCNEHDLHPTLVLIDGRFRVACFLATCFNTKIKTTVLFDDYAEREHYHVIETFIKPTRVICDRMAVFDITPGLLTTRMHDERKHYYFVTN